MKRPTWFYFYSSIYFLMMCIYVHLCMQVCLWLQAPREARRGHQSPWSSYRWLWAAQDECWQLHSGPQHEQHNFLTTGPSSLNYFVLFIFVSLVLVFFFSSTFRSCCSWMGIFFFSTILSSFIPLGIINYFLFLLSATCC